MLSINKRNPQRVYDMRETDAKKVALRILNRSPPQHPPDIYYIRRNEKMLNQYLEKDEMD